MRTYGTAEGVDRRSGDQILKAAKLTERMDAAVIADADAVTYTPAQLLGGLIVRDCNGAGRTDVLPTAADLVAALREEEVGDIVRCLIVNNSDAAETLTLSAGDGGSFTQIADTRVIPQNGSKMLHIRITGIGASPAYVAYV